MCSGGSPTPPPTLPEAPVMPDTATSRGNNKNKRRRQAATILTGSRGTEQQAATQQKTLLGQ